MNSPIQPVLRSHPTIPMKPKRKAAKALIIPGGILIALVGLTWAGLRIQPAPFRPIPQPSAPLQTIPLPAGLPTPVERFYRKVYGEQVPIITSAVISGRGWMRPFGGITLPMRFRFTHAAGRDYRHYIEATLFGLPVMQVNEYYVDGHERMELPFGVAEHDVRLDQGGNLGMWAEVLQSLPAILLTDPRVHWEPVDEVTALLVVPFNAEQERFVVRFDPVTARPRFTEVLRYRGTEATKTLWFTETRRDGTSTATWQDVGRPWLEVTIENVIYNADVDVSLTAKGP